VGLPDRVTHEAYSHECISAGFWPGTPDAPIREPIFYAYAYPEPPGCSTAAVRPAPAEYHPVLREWTLPYESVRQSKDPDGMLLEFLQWTYETAAELGGWNRLELERSQTTVAQWSAGR
jgi:hypothetical protein